MATQQERDICTAPHKKFRLVHVDPRDHWPTRSGEPEGTLEDVEKRLEGMNISEREVTVVFDDKGERVKRTPWGGIESTLLHPERELAS